MADSLSSVIQSAVQVSTPLGLLGLLGALIAWFAAQRREQSVRNQVSGPGFSGKDAIHILKEFRDDASRLAALTRLLKNDEANAKAIVAKVRGDIDVSLNQARQSRYLALGFAVVGGLLLAIGYAGRSMEPQSVSHTSPVAPAPAARDSADSHTSSAVSPSTARNSAPLPGPDHLPRAIELCEIDAASAGRWTGPCRSFSKRELKGMELQDYQASPGNQQCTRIVLYKCDP